MQDRTLVTRKDAQWLILREAGYEFTGGAMPSIFLTEGEAAPIIERNASWKGLRGKDKKGTRVIVGREWVRKFLLTKVEKEVDSLLKDGTL